MLPIPTPSIRRPCRSLFALAVLLGTGFTLAAPAQAHERSTYTWRAAAHRHVARKPVKPRVVIVAPRARTKYASPRARPKYVSPRARAKYVSPPRHRHVTTSGHARRIVPIELRRVLNDRQRRAHKNALTRALRAPAGKSFRWSKNGAAGWIHVIRGGSPRCRRIKQTVFKHGRLTTVHTRFRRQYNGAWRVTTIN